MKIFKISLNQKNKNILKILKLINQYVLSILKIIFLIKKNSKNYNLIEDNDLLYSSSLSSFNNENENKIKIVNKAKNDIREYKKELERLKIKPKYAIEENNKNELNSINGE